MTSPDPGPSARPEPEVAAPAPVATAPVPGHEAEPGGESVPRRAPALPEQSREDTDAGWGEYPEQADDRLYRDRPPHWGDF